MNVKTISSPICSPASVSPQSSPSLTAKRHPIVIDLTLPDKPPSLCAKFSARIKQEASQALQDLCGAEVKLEVTSSKVPLALPLTYKF